MEEGEGADRGGVLSGRKVPSGGHNFLELKKNKNKSYFHFYYVYIIISDIRSIWFCSFVYLKFVHKDIKLIFSVLNSFLFFFEILFLNTCIERLY